MNIKIEGKTLKVDYNKWLSSLEVMFEDDTNVYDTRDLGAVVLKFDQHDNLIGFKIEDLTATLKSLSNASSE